MMNSPIVSIIIPVYNVEKYLCQCLDSVKNQTMTDIEIICIDDGSTDNSGSILDEYASQDKRFVVIHQKNAGPSLVRNMGIELARGEFITFLDSDDWLIPTTIEKALSAFIDFSGEIVTYNFKLEYPPNCQEKRTIEQVHSSICIDNQTRFECIRQFEYVVWNKIYRKKFILDNNIRFPVGYRYEDVIFSALCACLSTQIKVLEDILYHYRQGNGFSTCNVTSQKKIAHIQILFKLLEELNQRDISQDLIYSYSSECYSIIRSFYLHHIDSTLRPTARQVILEHLSDSDWEKLQSCSLNLSAKKRAFYFWLNGKWLKAVWIYWLFLFRMK